MIMLDWFFFAKLDQQKKDIFVSLSMPSYDLATPLHPEQGWSALSTEIMDSKNEDIISETLKTFRNFGHHLGSGQVK